MKTAPAKPAAFPLLLASLVLAASLLLEPAAGDNQQACSNTYFASLVQLMPCRSAVVPFGPTLPSAMCCGAIRLLGQPCLCAIANGPPIAGVDRSMALQLPGKCSVNFEPCSD